jgi:hypothetical protein
MTSKNESKREVGKQKVSPKHTRTGVRAGAYEGYQPDYYS